MKPGVMPYTVAWGACGRGHLGLMPLLMCSSVSLKMSEPCVAQEKGAELLVKCGAEGIARRKNNNGVEFDRLRDKRNFQKGGNSPFLGWILCSHFSAGKCLLYLIREHFMYQFLSIIYWRSNSIISPCTA